jgi:hypothetical protein
VGGQLLCFLQRPFGVERPSQQGFFCHGSRGTWSALHPPANSNKSAWGSSQRQRVRMAASHRCSAARRQGKTAIPVPTGRAQGPPARAEICGYDLTARDALLLRLASPQERKPD